MSTADYELAPPPLEDRRLELWLQHFAGFILFENIRNYALAKVDPNANAEVRGAAAKAIDNALYGLMMQIDGVYGGFANPDFSVDLRVVAVLSRLNKPQREIISTLDLADGDGFCMGFHGWREGDFGDDPVAVPRI